MPPVNEAVLLMEDARRPKNQPFRFGKAFPVALNLANSGVWEDLPNGARLWRLRIVYAYELTHDELRIASRDARSINLTFSRFHVPDGAELYIYNDDHSHVLGSYNALNHNPDGRFATEAVLNDAITLEYMEPSWADFPGELEVGQVVHAYQEIIVYIIKGAAQPKAAGACEVDVNCPQGVGWENEIDAVARILTGPYLCTGSLLNNTANEGTQYFITASHCGTLNSAIFYFNYQRSGCGTGTAPLTQTVQGSTQMAVDTTIDYRLVKITPAIPASYGVYYAGWDRTDVAPSSSACIHHPAGDPKKISHDYNAPLKSGNDWHINQWDVGATEGGSSGSPLYSVAHRFIGQLWGGQSDCSYPYHDYYGRLAKSWNGVKAYLDPLNTGATSIAGLDPNACPSPSNYGTGEIGSTGTMALVSASGEPTVGNPSFYIVLTGAKPNQFCCMLSGDSQASVPYAWGTVLVGAPNFLRTYSATNGSGGCSINIPITSGMVGTTKYYQYVARDAGYGGDVQASNGLMVTFCP